MAFVANPAPLLGGGLGCNGDFRSEDGHSDAHFVDLPDLVPAGDILADAMASSGVLFGGPGGSNANLGGGSAGGGSVISMPPVPPGSDADTVQASNNLVQLGKQLLASARDGDTEEVRQLIGRGAPFTTDWLGTSPLHMSAQYGHADTCVRLLAAGISKNAVTKVDKTPLHVAATEGYTEVMEVLLRARCDVDAEDLLKMTPLHWAVDRGHVAAVELLLRYGASVGICSKFDKTPLDIANDNRWTDISDILENPEPYRMQPGEYDANVMSDPVTVAATNSIAVSDDSDIKRIIQQELVGSPPAATAPASATLLPTAPVAAASKSDAMRLLEAHGITLLPEDNGAEAPLTNLLRSGGQRLALTEAGKLALSGTASSSSPAPTTVIRPTAPIVIRKTVPAGGITKVVPKLISVNKSGVRQVIRPVSLGAGVTTVPTAVAASGAAPAKRRITVSPAQLARLKEIQKAGGTCRVVVGADGKKTMVVKRPVSAASAASTTTTTRTLAGLGATASPAPVVLAAGGGTKIVKAAQPAGTAGTKTVKIIRVDKDTGNIVSNMVLPSSAVTTAGGTTTTRVIPASSASRIAISGAQALTASSSGGDPKELEKTRKEFEELKRAMEEKNRELDRLRKQLEEAKSSSPSKAPSSDSERREKESAASEEMD